MMFSHDSFTNLSTYGLVTSLLSVNPPDTPTTLRFSPSPPIATRRVAATTIFQK
jgi:hypothetical protein